MSMITLRVPAALKTAMLLALSPPDPIFTVTAFAMVCPASKLSDDTVGREVPVGEPGEPFKHRAHQ